jgi:hypothetical protein
MSARDPYNKLREVMAMLPEPAMTPLAIGPAPVKPRQPSLPMRVPAVQQQLALGFFLEPQDPRKAKVPWIVPAKQDGVKLHDQKCRPQNSDAEPQVHAKTCRCGGSWVDDLIPGRIDAYCDRCNRWRSDTFGWQKATTPAPAAPNPPKRATKAVKAADDQGAAKGPTRGSKEPPGHVWWVSERWTVAHNDRSERDPSDAEFELTGMQLENANGQNRGSMGAMHAHQGREKKRRQWALTSATVNASQFIGWPVRITLVRVAPNAVDDDNLGQMFKRVRDGICEALGFRDDKRREGFLDWKYEQRKGGNRADMKKGVSAVHHVVVRVEVMA